MDSLIVLFENFAPADVCDRLIQRFDESPHKQPGRTGSGVDQSKKTSSDLMISGQESWRDECTQIDNMVFRGLTEYCRRYPHMLTGALSPTILDEHSGQARNLKSEDIGSLSAQQLQMLVAGIYRLDQINFQHYEKARGGYYHWHSEHYPHPSDPNQKSLHRVLFWLLYLNDVEEGGETEFHYQGVKIKPRKGSLILSPCGFTHTHRGNIPQSHDKYILTSWIMYRAAGELYRTP
ncbi:2OG-Fe(II) oxygenase superfamily protein [Microbulbifer donghaiensis]|uniref:2OG-Fe(II) oxygenase superfamily protein n=1 Tax=Microbulbifer donghaiensis TaxID=494016 RepID=A0A1M5EBE4_9GAMM|nr:2OG-Fe(II) oxygenase [Microbulbifer donghaiensis]SHF76422.1 2OG-Fe(II) oxygenase superfamily protein [Microbulbifer donghaiensis]